MTKWQQLVREKMLVNAYDVLRLKFVVHCEKIKFKLFFKKMGQPWPLFHLFPVFSNKHYNFLQQIYSSLEPRLSQGVGGGCSTSC